MTPDTPISLANLAGKLVKPADTLIKKISSAAGILYGLEKIAEAEAKAALIKARSDIEITDLQRRAANRWMAEEAQRQKNMEDITDKALPQLDENAKPESMDNDWVANFFDKCRIVSDGEMQGLWSRVLAGEANAPGSYSKRTVNFLSDLDKAEAGLFTKLCGFGWQIGNVVPLVFDVQAEIYNKYGINFSTLSHLESIGLVQFDNLAGFINQNLPKKFDVLYYDRALVLEMPQDAGNPLQIGKVLLTRIGQELAPICGSKPVDGFWEYVKDQWKEYSPEEAVVQRSTLRF